MRARVRVAGGSRLRIRVATTIAGTVCPGFAIATDAGRSSFGGSYTVAWLLNRGLLRGVGVFLSRCFVEVGWIRGWA